MNHPFGAIRITLATQSFAAVLEQNFPDWRAIDDLQAGLLSSDANEVLKTVSQSDLKCHASGETESA